MKEKLPSFLLLVAVLFVMVSMAFILPWQQISWGKFDLRPTETISVNGMAKKDEANQIARFTAGVSAQGLDKQRAVDEVGEKLAAVINKVKEFGIDEKDIKTQNLGIYQQRDSYYEEGQQKTRPGEWSVNNNIEIKLRDVNRASELFDLLSQTGVTNLNGPQFSIDDTSSAELDLLDAAVANALEKAEVLAKSSGKKIVKVLSISDNTSAASIYPIFEGMGGGGGGPTSVGTGTVQANVRVVFEVK